MTLIELFGCGFVLVPFCLGHFGASHPRGEPTKNYPPEEINITDVKLVGFDYSKDLHYGKCPKDESKGFCYYTLSTNLEYSTIKVYPECEYAWGSTRYYSWDIFSELFKGKITVSGPLNKWSWCNRCGIWLRTKISKKVERSLNSLGKKCPTKKEAS
jgi:hypothetical protein